MLPDFEGTQRFAIARTLGAGSFGVVYEAIDSVTKSRVALKTLRNVSPESLYRLKREFRSLCDMAHPNLVQLYELFAEDAGWFFTMELVDGVPFTQYTWRAHTEPPGFDSAPTEEFTEQHPLDISRPRTAATAQADLARLENALPQLVRAVARLHRDGKLHRDLKPSNVLVTAEGRVVVLDFGLVIDYTGDSTGSIQLAGTPSYMSPEQSRADVLTPASDWYSVGAIVYEVLTGEPPFAGESLRSKQSREPRPPGEIVRGIPKTLEQLCVRLLRLDPSQRPGAEEILEALERRGARAETRPATRATFVGREADLETLRKALDEDKPDGAVVVCVEGVSGIGKSTFVRKFLDDAVREHPPGDLLILSGRCYERESVPYKAVDAIIDELHRYLRGLDAKSVGALLPRDFPALAQLFPVLQALSDVSPSRRPQLAADSQEVRRRGFAALREMFQRMSDRMRVALFVDDLQWGDVDSADLLLEILRGEDAPPLLFIGAYRSDEIGDSPFLRVFLNERTGLRLQRVRLEPLPSADVLRLAESLLGTSDARIAQLVADGAAGSPFLADTLVRALAIDESLLAGAESGVSTLLHRIVGQLDADPQRVLHLIAVNGRPLQTAVLQTALTGGAYEPSMGTLRSEHLVRTVGRGEREAIEIYHDRMREMIIGSLSERSVRRYHRVLIDLLEAHGTVDSELLAVHAEGARDEERAAKYLVLAAEEAAAALAFDRAARLYGRALAVTSDRNPRFEELKTRRADMLTNAGRGSEAAAEYLAVPAQDEFTKLRLRTKAGQQLLFSGFIDRGLDVYRTVLAAAGMRWPKTQLQTIAMFVAERLRLTLRGFKTHERDESSIDANQLIRLDTSWSVAVGLSTVDPPRGSVFQTRHLRLALDAGEPNRLVRALATETAYSAAPGEPTRRRAEKLLRRSRDLAGRLSSPAASAYADFGEGIASHLLGEWQRGAAVLERAEETFLQSCTGVMWEIDTSRLFSLRCRWFLGDTALIVSRTPRLLRDAEERGDQYFRTMIHVCLSPYARMVEDAADAAVADLEGAMRDWSPSDLQYQHIWYVRAMADVALYRNDVGTARSVIEDFWPRLKKSLLWRVQFTRVSVMDVRARAALAAARQSTGAEREELIGLASKMARDIDTEKTLWGKPFASIIKAAVATLRNDRQSASAALVEAARRAERCSMRLYEAAARIRLAEVESSPKNVADATANRESMSSRGIRNPEALARMLVP
jgi:hypothetical protein